MRGYATRVGSLRDDEFGLCRSACDQFHGGWHHPRGLRPNGTDLMRRELRYVLPSRARRARPTPDMESGRRRLVAARLPARLPRDFVWGLVMPRDALLPLGTQAKLPANHTNVAWLLGKAT